MVLLLLPISSIALGVNLNLENTDGPILIICTFISLIGIFVSVFEWAHVIARWIEYCQQELPSSA